MSLLPPSPLLDETIASGQSGHIADHEAIAEALNTDTMSLAGDQTASGEKTFNEINANIARFAVGPWVDVMHPAYGVVGDGTNDDTAEVQDAADAAVGRMLVFSPDHTYIIDPTTPIEIPDNTLVWIQRGATVKMKPNIATANAIYRLFAPASATPQNIAFIVDGLVDGNRRGGNHGAGENVAGLWFSDITGFQVIGTGRFYNFRSEAVYCGHAAVVPSKLFFDGIRVEDCGFAEAGDTNTNDRQGIAVIAAQDAAFGPGLDFDTIASFAIDAEGNGVTNASETILAANANRKAAYVQVVSGGNARVTIDGVDATITLGIQVSAGGAPLVIQAPFCPTTAIKAIREGSVDAVIQVVEIA